MTESQTSPLTSQREKYLFLIAAFQYFTHLQVNGRKKKFQYFTHLSPTVLSVLVRLFWGFVLGIIYVQVIDCFGLYLKDLSGEIRLSVVFLKIFHQSINIIGLGSRHCYILFWEIDRHSLHPLLFDIPHVLILERCKCQNQRQFTRWPMFRRKFLWIFLTDQ